MSGKPNTALRDAIRAGYRAGLTPSEIAKTTGSTVGSVKVLAHKMGVNDTPHMAAVKRWSRKTGSVVEHSASLEIDGALDPSTVSYEMLRDLGFQSHNKGATA